MPTRFGQADDYSSVFASLYYRNQDAIEAAALRVERDREEREAARDALVFTKWQEGKLSGSELMAYIQQRMRATKYDKAQQLQWREAAITYGNQIGDEEAEARYAESGNITDLIAYYAGRLASARTGTPERRELAQRLQGLREKRDQDNLERQARKISRQVQRGDKSTKDLIAFYQGQLKTLPKGELRQQVMDQLVQLREQYRQEQFTVAMQRIDTRLASGALSPQQAAQEKQALLGRFDVQTRSPEEFWQWQEQIRKLRATPDPVEVEKLEFQMAAGKVTPEQYVAQINIWASRIAPYDQAAAWQMRTEAEKYVSEFATPLANPGAIGGFSGNIEIAKNLRGASIKHITQLDDSAYAGTNCAMASGAMLAYAMGVRNLSGSDLRYLSGDVSGGTNVSQVQAALEALGITGTRLNYGSTGGATFEEFKRRVANGAPAVLQGFNDMLPPELLPYDYRGAHGVFVAGYDAKKDAFLVLDPAKSSDPGVWWPAQVVNNFGFENGRMNGLALFAPRGTLDPKTLARVGGKVKFINVDTLPQRPSTPPTAGGLYDPGPDFKGKMAEVARRRARFEDRRLNKSLELAGIEPGELSTEQEVQAELERRSKAHFQTAELLDEYMTLYQESGEETQDVVIGDVTKTMNLQDFLEMSKEQLYLLDGQERYYEALGDDEGAFDMRMAKKDVVKNGMALRVISEEQAQGRMVLDLERVLERAERARDIPAFKRAVDEATGILKMLAGAERYDPLSSAPLPEPEERADDTTGSEVSKQAEELQSDVSTGAEGPLQVILNIIADPEMEQSEKVQAAMDVAKAANLNMPIERILDIAGMATLLTTGDENGQALGTMVLIGGEMVVVPTVASTRQDPATREIIPIRVPALDMLPDKAVPKDISGRGFDLSNPETLPAVFVPNGRGGLELVRAIPEKVPYGGVTFLQIPEGITQAQRAGLPESIRNLPAGTILDHDQVNDPELHRAGAIGRLEREGLVKRKDLEVERVILTGPDGETVAYFRDDGTDMWHKGALPFVLRKTENVGFGHGLVGGVLDERGQVWPDVETDIDLMDDTSLGSSVIVAPGVTQEQAGIEFRKLEEKGWNLDPLRRRDLDGKVIDIDKTNEAYLNQFKPENASIRAAIAKRNEGRALATQRIAQLGGPSPADMAFMEDAEKRSLAQTMNIVYDGPNAGQYLPGFMPEEARPGAVTLEGLGINKGEEKKTTEEPKRFDPVGAVVGAALGVAAANKKALAEREAAQESARKLSLPTVQPKPTRSTIQSPVSLPGVQTQRAPLTRNASTGDMAPELPSAGTAHANRTRPVVAPAPTSSYTYTPPKMDEEGRTALGGGR